MAAGPSFSTSRLHGPRQPVDAGDDQGVAAAQKVEQHLQFGAAVTTGAARLLGADHVTAGSLQRGALEGEVLLDRGDTGIAVEGHSGKDRVGGQGRGAMSWMILDLLWLASQVLISDPNETKKMSHRLGSLGYSQAAIRR